MKNYLKKSFLVILIIQIISIFEKHVFDFLGYMWLLIVVNFVQIVFLIFGFYGVKQEEDGYVLMYKIWTLLWIVWNVILCCMYTEIGNLKDSYHYLNFKIRDKSADGRSWWSYNQILCIPLSKIYSHHTTIIPFKESQLHLQKSYPKNDCLFNGHIIDLFHACFQLLLAIIALLLSFYYSVFRENKLGTCELYHNLRKTRKNRNDVGFKNKTLSYFLNYKKNKNLFNTNSPSMLTSTSIIEELHQNQPMENNPYERQNGELFTSGESYNQSMKLGKRKSPFYNLYNPRFNPLQDDSNYGMGEIGITNRALEIKRRQPITTNLDDSLEPWGMMSTMQINNGNVLRINKLGEGDLFPPPPPGSLSTMTTAYPCYNSDGLSSSTNPACPDSTSKFSKNSPSPIVPSTVNRIFSNLKPLPKTRKGINNPDKMNLQLSSARKRRTNRGSTRRNRLKNRTGIHSSNPSTSFLSSSAQAIVPPMGLSVSRGNDNATKKSNHSLDGYIWMDDKNLNLNLNDVDDVNHFNKTGGTTSNNDQCQIVPHLLKDSRRKNIMQLQDINYLCT